MTYYGEFKSWSEVMESFSVPAEKDPKPDYVVYAEYDQEDYSGYAVVLYIKDGKLYLADGSHCSCFGLEDQWTPNELSIEEIKHYYENGSYGIWKDKPKIREALIVYFELLDQNLTEDEIQLYLKLRL